MFTNGNHDFLYYITTPPGSMLFILFLSILIAVISTGLTKLLVDTNELNRKQILIKAHQEEKQYIMKLAEEDPVKYRKRRKRWERKEVMLKQTQQRMALQRLKPTCITFLPMIIIFTVIRGLFNNNPVCATAMNAWDLPLLGGVVQALTGDSIDAATGAIVNGVAWDWTALVYGTKRVITPEMGWINFTAWYFICSLGLNTLLQRLLGIQTQASGGMESMFSGQKSQSQQFPDV